MSTPFSYGQLMGTPTGIHSMEPQFRQDKLAAYAMATEEDIAAIRFEQVRDSKVWSGWVGTVYGCKVQGGDRFGFDSYEEAVADAHRFVEQCATAVSEQAANLREKNG